MMILPLLAFWGMAYGGEADFYTLTVQGQDLGLAMGYNKDRQRVYIPQKLHVAYTMQYHCPGQDGPLKLARSSSTVLGQDTWHSFIIPSHPEECLGLAEKTLVLRYGIGRGFGSQLSEEVSLDCSSKWVIHRRWYSLKRKGWHLMVVRRKANEGAPLSFDDSCQLLVSFSHLDSP